MFIFEKKIGPINIPANYSFENLIKWLNDDTRFDQYKPKHTKYYHISSHVEKQGKVGKVMVDQKKDGAPIYEDIPEKRAVVHYYLGSNGPGLSNEILALGADISHWSKYYWITISDESFVDPLDDVYDIYVTYQERRYELNEGASGYYPKDSDEYWDEASKFKNDLLSKLIKGLNSPTNEVHYGWAYTYMGLTNAALAANDLLSLWADDDQTIELVNSYYKAYTGLASDNENLMGWKDFDKYKKALENTKNGFVKIMKSKYNIDVKAMRNDLQTTNESICNAHYIQSKNINEHIDDKITIKTKHLDIKKDLDIKGHTIAKEKERDVVEYILKNKGWICEIILRWYDMHQYGYRHLEYVSSLSDKLRKCFYNPKEPQLNEIPANYTLFDALCEFSLYDGFNTFIIDTAPGDGIVTMCEEYIEKNFPDLVKKYLGVNCKIELTHKYNVKPSGSEALSESVKSNIRLSILK